MARTAESPGSRRGFLERAALPLLILLSALLAALVLILIHSRSPWFDTRGVNTSSLAQFLQASRIAAKSERTGARMSAQPNPFPLRHVADAPKIMPLCALRDSLVTNIH